MLELNHHGVTVVAAFEELLLSGQLRIVGSPGSPSIVRELRVRCPSEGTQLHLAGDGLIVSSPTLSEVSIEAVGPVSVVADGTTCGTVSGPLGLSLGSRTLLVQSGGEATR